MPEGPEVFIIAEQLRDALIGATIVDIYVPRGTNYQLSADIRKATAGLPTPLIIKYIGSKGKFLWFWFSGKDRNYFLGNSLGLAGVWSLTREPPKGALLQFILGNGRLLCYSDVRHFGKFKNLSIMELARKLDKLGPDILQEAAPRPTLTKNGKVILRKYAQDNTSSRADAFIETARKPIMQKKNIANILMNQKVLSGVGNYIKAEALYRARIFPGALAQNLPDSALRALYKHVLEIARASVVEAGVSFRDFVDISGKKGHYNLQVYGARFDHRGRAVMRADFGDGRTTYWVPEIQKIGLITPKVGIKIGRF